MRLKRYVLADPQAKLPMPDRGGRLYSDDGETIDVENPYWAARIADGELLPDPSAVAPEGPARNRKGK